MLTQERRPGEQVEQRELDRRDLQPGVRPELGPAQGQVTPGRARRRGDGRDPEQGQGGQADAEAARVRGDHRRRAGDRDEHPGQRRAGDLRNGLGDAQQRVGVGQAPGRRDLRRQAAERGLEEGLGGSEQTGLERE
jgi:hypothetical protein